MAVVHRVAGPGPVQGGAGGGHWRRGKRWGRPPREGAWDAGACVACPTACCWCSPGLEAHGSGAAHGRHHGQHEHVMPVANLQVAGGRWMREASGRRRRVSLLCGRRPTGREALPLQASTSAMGGHQGDEPRLEIGSERRPGRDVLSRRRGLQRRQGAGKQAT